MNDLLKLQDIASLLQHQLNTISSDLFGFGLIPREETFYITDSVGLYQKWQTMDNDLQFNFGILKSTSFRDNQFVLNGTIEESFILSVVCYEKNRDNVEKIFNTLTKNKIETPLFRHDDWLIKFIPGKYDPNNFQNSQDGRNEKLYYTTYTFIFEYRHDYLTANDVKLKIDNVDIPFFYLDFDNVKSSIANVPFSKNNNNYKMVAETIVLGLPLGSNNAKVNDIILSAGSDRYNDLYSFSLDLKNFTKNVDYTIKRGSLSVNKDIDNLMFNVVFEMATPRIELKIDDVLIPALNFQIATSRATTQINGQDLEIKHSIHNFGYAITATFIHINDNPKSVELLNEARIKTTNTTHTILYEDETYEVITTDATDSFTEAGNIIYNLTFVARKVG